MNVCRPAPGGDEGDKAQQPHWRIQQGGQQCRAIVPRSGAIHQAGSCAGAQARKQTPQPAGARSEDSSTGGEVCFWPSCSIAPLLQSSFVRDAREFRAGIFTDPPRHTVVSWQSCAAMLQATACHSRSASTAVELKSFGS